MCSQRSAWIRAIAIIASMAGCSDSNPSLLVAVHSLPTIALTNSAEPNLASTPNGTVVMSWLEPAANGVALRFSTLDEREWTAARTVTTGTDWFVNWADFPSVVPISEAHWAAHWLVKREGNAYAYDVAVASSTDAGQSWSRPITPHRDDTATEHGFVSLFPARGGVGLLWLDGRNMAQEQADNASIADSGMTLRSAVLDNSFALREEWVVDGLVCDCCQTDVSTTSQGAVAVYRNRSETEIRDIFVTRLVNGAWTPGKPVASDGWEIAGCPVNGPAIASREQNVAVAWFTAANDRPTVRFARSTDGALSFANAIDIDSEQPLGRVDVELLDSGHSLVSWLQETVDGGAIVSLAGVSPDGNVGPAMKVAETRASRRSGFPQMVVSGDSIIVAWTDVKDEQTQVLSACIDTHALLGTL